MILRVNRYYFREQRSPNPYNGYGLCFLRGRDFVFKEFCVNLLAAYLEVDEDVRVFGHGQLLIESHLCKREEADAGTEPQQEQQHNSSAHPEDAQQVGRVTFFQDIT
jgi:hypothetical protein